PSPSARTGRRTNSRPKSQRRGYGPYAPSGTSFSFVASWLKALKLSVSAASRSVAARPGGLAFGHLLVLRHRIVLEDLALEDPDLDATGAEGRERGRNPVVHVGAPGVGRD